MEVTDPLYLAHIVESSNEAIIAVNLHNHVTYWNGAAERTFGYTRAEVLRRDVRDLICPHTARDHSTSSDQFATDGPNENPPAPTLSEDCECHVEDLAKKMTPYIARRRKKSGEPVDMLISVSPVYAPTMSLFSSSPAILLPPHLFAPHPITTPPTALPSPVGSDVLSVASELTSSSALSNNSSVTEGIVTGYATILTPIDYQGDQESLKFPIALPSHAFTFSSIEQSSSHLPQIMIDAIPPSPSVAFASAISVHTSQLTSAALSRLYERTFPLVGKEFLESLVSVLALMLDFDCVFVYEALSYEDWVESGGKDDVVNCAGDDPGASMTNSSPMNNGLSSLSVAASSSSLSLPSSSIAPDEVMLLARARWWPGMNDSDKGNESVLPCTILPLAGHPHEYTLSKQKHVVFKDLRSTYPFYQGYASYVGLRLDGPDGPVGVIGIMDARPMEMDRVVVVSELLDGVCQRVTAEMVRLRTEARLLKAKETAEQDADNKTKFLADMSHEIRTPMNAVIALTDLLLQDRMSLNDEQTEHLEVIQTSGQHLLTVINDILDISKINHDPKFRLESRYFNLRKCVKDTLNMARHQSAIHHANKVIHVLECPPDIDDTAPLAQIVTRHLHGGSTPPLPHVRRGKALLPLIWKIDDDVPEYVIGDSMRLMQIMINLCSNAVKFTKEGRIRVHIRRTLPTPPCPTSPSSGSSSPPASKVTFKQRYDAKMEVFRSRMRRKSVGRREDRRSETPVPPANTPEIVAADDGATNGDGMGNGIPVEKVVLEFSVTDTGIGIPADRLPRLFKSFSQIDISTARRFGGTGLGLAISSTLVNLMGGAMWVESEEGAGSRFAFTIPLPVYHLSMYPGGSPSPSSSISDASTVDSSPSLSRSFTDMTIRSSTPSTPPGVGSSTTLSSSPSGPSSGYFPPSPSHEPSHTHKRNHSGSQLWAHIGQGLPFHIPGLNNTHDNYLQPPGGEKQRLPEQQQHLLSPPTHEHVYVQGSEQVQQKRTEAASLLASRHAYQQHTKNRSSDENLGSLYPIKILLAEDNILNQKIALSILKRLGYSDVDVANNGREVLDMMRSTKYDLILMDLYMPIMDGLEATRKIVTSRLTYVRSSLNSASSASASAPPHEAFHLLNAADVYIIALTASASHQDRQTCADAGMNDFLGKPFTMLEMRASLKNYIYLRKKGKRRTTDEVMDALIEHSRPAHAHKQPGAGREENG